VTTHSDDSSFFLEDDAPPAGESIPLPADLGPFRLERVIGQGGMGEVFLAYDSRLERKVAIKKIRNEAALDAVNRQRLLREAKIGAKLSHPAIVQVFDIVELADFHWIVMELVEGTTVAQMVRSGPIDVAVALSIARQVAEGLAEAHDKGLLHRDLKSENVMVGAKNRVKILDFGLAKPVDANKDSSLTADGEVMGTCRSMSPEQAKGLELDGRSDLFSLGVLLYEMTTGISPFRAPSPVATLTLVCTHDPEPAALLNPTLPYPVSNFIGRLLDKDRRGRPADGLKAAAEIAEIESQLTGTLQLAADNAPAVPAPDDPDDPTHGRGLPLVSRRAPIPPKRVWPPPSLDKLPPPGAPTGARLVLAWLLFALLVLLAFYFGFAK
jgi:serine/threonine protein kinase